VRYTNLIGLDWIGLLCHHVYKVCGQVVLIWQQEDPVLEIGDFLLNFAHVFKMIVLFLAEG
jgi:hypothetical protein